MEYETSGDRSGGALSPAVIVFRSSQAEAFEFGAVLDAKALAYERAT